jgi:hypothetical protein
MSCVTIYSPTRSDILIVEAAREQPLAASTSLLKPLALRGSMPCAAVRPSSRAQRQKGLLKFLYACRRLIRDGEGEPTSRHDLTN